MCLLRKAFRIIPVGFLQAKCLSLCPINTVSTHTHPFNGHFSGTIWGSWYQKGKTNLDFTETRDSEWQWHQLGYNKSATSSRQITMPAPNHSVFTGRVPYLLPNQQRQSTEGQSSQHCQYTTRISYYIHSQ